MTDRVRYTLAAALVAAVVVLPAWAAGAAKTLT